nr:conserved hypothetical protein [uncultured bacterium]
MLCPVCRNHDLKPIELEPDLKVASCDGCSGAWLAKDDYDAWQALHPEEPPATTAPVEIQVGEIAKAKLCPQCNHLMVKYRIGHGLGFFIDHCNSCGGFWLDGNEWPALKLRGLHHNLDDVLSSRWQKDVRQQEIQEKLDEVYIRQLGRETYDKMREIRVWLDGQPNRSMILAYLAESRAEVQKA